MLNRLIIILLCLPLSAFAQQPADWARLRQYVGEIGVEEPCDTPTATCLRSCFMQIVYGKPHARLGYQGLKERVDTARINQLTDLFLTGADWCPLLDSMESHDPAYRQLKAYCIRCLVDDYMADSLTIEQVKTTLNFYRWLNRFPADKRVIVNIPSATLRVLDQDGTIQLSSRVIVGKPGTPTPLFNAQITGLVTYPYWNVPHSIAINELLPKIWKNPAATLAAMNLQIIDGTGAIVSPESVNWSAYTVKTFPHRLRQSTGCDNALGILKFNVNDPYDIYLHDTNQRTLFTHDKRTLSHGCIRVEKPVELANLVLGKPHFARSFLTTCQKQTQPKTVTIPKPIPVIVTYNLLDVDDQGAIVVYKDVYGWWKLDS